MVEANFGFLNDYEEIFSTEYKGEDFDYSLFSNVLDEMDREHIRGLDESEIEILEEEYQTKLRMDESELESPPWWGDPRALDVFWIKPGGRTSKENY